MTNPDYTPFIDLALYDKVAEDIYDAALVTLQSRMPDWKPTETNTEVMLLEALAIEVSETIFTLNRLPVNMVRVLLSLYGVGRDPGEPASTTITFTMLDTDGYVIPAGTEVVIALANDELVSFFTNTDLSVVGLTGTVSATSNEYSSSPNGIPSNTAVEVVSAVIGLDSAKTASIVAGGRDLETLDAWTQRGVQRLQRLSEVLVLPRHFTQAALENANVVRANTVDNYDITDVGADPGDNLGHVTVVVYGDNANLTTEQKAELLAEIEALSVANLVVHIADPVIESIDVTATVKVAATYSSSAVLAAVSAQLAEFLSPDSWQWAGTVRINDLVSIIDQVPGVEYVNSIIAPASDVVIDAGITLVSSGTINVTAI
jgi:uncharacterized phage protein gp47/JayE